MNRGGYQSYGGNGGGGHSTSGANSQADKIKSLRCVFCNEDKPLDAFSATQIQKATFNPFCPPSYNKKKKTVSCKKCTSTQNTSLTCMICSKTKPLEHFAKSQRKNAEKARCILCIKKREEEDVWDSDDTDSDDEFDYA